MDMPQKSNKGKIFLLAFLVLALVLVVAAIAKKKITKKTAQVETAATVTATGPDGKALPALPEPPKIEAPAEVTSISGTVEKIEGNTLTVKAFFFGEQKTYAVTVGDNTKIQKREMKKDVPKPEEGKTFEPFTITDAKLGDIRQNDNVTVEASENIKDKTSFVAKTISIEVMNLPDLPEPPKIEDLPKLPDMPAVPSMPSVPAPPAVK